MYLVKQAEKPQYCRPVLFMLMHIVLLGYFIGPTAKKATTSLIAVY